MAIYIYVCVCVCYVLFDCILDVRAKTKRRLPSAHKRARYRIAGKRLRRAKLSTVKRACRPFIDRTALCIKYNNIRRELRTSC